jgi:hypothetical protein
MIWWRIEIMNLLMQLYPVSCCFLHFGCDRGSLFLYFRSIIWCLQCHRFGHTHQKCASGLVHGICNESGHGESPCFSPLHCWNYSGAHASGDMNCPMYRNEKAIQELGVMEGLSKNSWNQTQAWGKVLCISPSTTHKELNSSCLFSDQTEFGYNHNTNQK